MMRAFRFFSRFKDRRSGPLFLVMQLALMGPWQAVAQEMSPDTIYHPTIEHPLFVSAKRAEAQPTLDPSLFHPLAIADINAIFEATPVHGCYPVEPVVIDRYGGRPAPYSFTEAARSYPVIALGTVKELTPGFRVGNPGFLVRAEAEEGSRNIAVGATFFLLIPVGDFTFRGKRICREDPSYVRLPKVDEEVLLFADPAGTSEVEFLLIDYPQNLILISGEEVLYSSELSRHEADEGALPASRTELLRSMAQLPDANPGE